MSGISKFNSLISLLRTRKSRKPKLIGSQDTILSGGLPKTKFLRQLDIPEAPLRPILFSIDATRSLLEMNTWSYEFSTCLRIISQNVFQDENGFVDSWDLHLDKDNSKNPDSYTQGMIQALRNRCYGRDEVLGGEILEPAVRAICGLGDSFMDCGIVKDGGSYTIEKTMYLPTMSMFVEEDEQANIVEYRQQSSMNPGIDDPVWRGTNTAKILHFKSPNTGRYGLVPALPQIDTWEDIKNTVADVADAARGASVLPTVHTMPPQKQEGYKNAYRDDYEARQREGIILDLFLMNGAKVEKLAAATPSIKPLLDNFINLRYRMVYPGFPIYLIPGLGLEQGASKELSGGPALAYGKMINTIRSYLAKQIIWAIGVEITMSKGFDYWIEQKPKVRISWPTFITQEVPGLNPRQQEESATETFSRVNGSRIQALLR